MSLFIIVKLFLYFLGRKLEAWPVWATSSMCWWGRTDSSRLFRALRSPAPPPTATAAVGLHLCSSCNSCNNMPPHRYTVTAAGPKDIHREWKGVVGRWGPGYSVSDPDPSDPHVFGPLGSIIQIYGSGFGSGSSYHQAKKVRKTLIPTVL